MPILGTFVAVLAVLWGILQLLPALIFQGGSFTCVLIGELILSSTTALFLALTAPLINKSFSLQKPLMYMQLSFLLLSASFSLYYKSEMPYGLALFLLVVLLGIYYRVIGRRIFIGLTIYFSLLIINFSYQRSSFLQGLGALLFLLISYAILYLVYCSFFEREGSLKEQLGEIIEAQKKVISDKEAMIDQLKPDYYHDKVLTLTKAEKSLLDCIWLYREVGNKELSRLTGKSESTIRNRIFSICRKLGFDRRTKLLTLVLESPSDIEELPVVEDIYYG